jgi:hypothetical protein
MRQGEAAPPAVDNGGVGKGLNEKAIFTKRTHLENRRKANNGAGQSGFLPLFQTRQKG